MSEAHDVRLWDWEREPDAPRTWTSAERRLVVCEPGLLGAPITTLNEASLAADEGAWLVSDCREILNRRERLIFALYARRQADIDGQRCESCSGSGTVFYNAGLDEHGQRRGDLPRACSRCCSGRVGGLGQFLSVHAERRALVCSPREALDLAASGALGCTCPGEERCSGGCPFYRAFHVTDVKRRVDLLIIMGEVGHDARPMHPKHVRSLVEQGRAASVPVVFAGWGEWVPRSQQAVSERDRRTLPTLPLGGDDFAVRVGADRSGALFDGAEVRDPIPWLGVAS